MAYFSGFPLALYKFGSEATVTSFQNISVYVEIIDTIKDNINFHNPIQIGDNERPDTLSQKLYGTPTLYWTFFLMNDQIRERGWPLSNQELDKLIKSKLPNKVLLSLDIDNVIAIPVGTTVTGLTSGAIAKVVDKRTDFGQLIIETSSGVFVAGELVSYTPTLDTIVSFTVSAVVDQYNSIHHWENDEGLYQDIDPAVGTSAFDTPVTFYELYQRENDELKQINVIKLQAITTVQKAFKEALSK